MDLKKNVENLKKIKEKMEKDIENNIEANNSSIAIFKRIPGENYYYPYNKAALNYSLNVVNKNLRELQDHIEFKGLERNEKTELLSQYNKLLDYFNRIKIKDKGKITINEDFLVFQEINGKWNPLNINSEANLINIYELMSATPKTNEKLWKKIKVM